MWKDKNRMREQTLEHFKRMSIIRLKHFNGLKGMASFNNNEYKLILDKTNELIVFKDIDALSDSGWTID